MTREIVRSWAGKLAHITKEVTDTEIKTLCGRTIKNYQIGYPGETDCPKCGSARDFKEIWEAKRLARLEIKRKQEIESKERQARNESRLAAHREAMAGLEKLLVAWGANINDIEERPAGGEIKFSKDGLKFKLSGNIF